MRRIISVGDLVAAYSSGYFPMADSRRGRIRWYSPDPRAIIPLEYVKMPRSMRQHLKKAKPEFTVNAAFETVIRECADREDSWISEEIIQSYTLLHKAGYAHSVETWTDGNLSGGLYGVAIGGAFFGESMFSRASNASKAAFYFLTERLIERGFILLDSQFLNPHTEYLGAIEIPRFLYIELLKKAVSLPATFI